MLKIECPKCCKWVHLTLHGDEEEVSCPDCNEMIPVKDVYVAAGPYMIFRDVLQKNMHKYKRLLLEAEKEIQDLQKKADGLNRSYDISAKTVNMFVTNLKEMLEGCRDTIRHSVDDVVVEYVINGRGYRGRLVNLGVSGMCLVAGKTATVTRLWNEMVVNFRPDETGDPVPLPGKIVWLGKGNLMGVKFLDLDGKKKKMLRDYIQSKSAKK